MFFRSFCWISRALLCSRDGPTADSTSQSIITQTPLIPLKPNHILFSLLGLGFGLSTYPRYTLSRFKTRKCVIRCRWSHQINWFWSFETNSRADQDVLWHPGLPGSRNHQRRLLWRRSGLYVDIYIYISFIFFSLSLSLSFS